MSGKYRIDYKYQRINSFKVYYEINQGEDHIGKGIIKIFKYMIKQRYILNEEKVIYVRESQIQYYQNNKTTTRIYVSIIPLFDTKYFQALSNTLQFSSMARAFTTLFTLSLLIIFFIGKYFQC